MEKLYGRSSALGTPPGQESHMPHTAPRVVPGTLPQGTRRH
jgi:hypothetical protein